MVSVINLFLAVYILYSCVSGQDFSADIRTFENGLRRSIWKVDEHAEMPPEFFKYVKRDFLGDQLKLDMGAFLSLGVCGLCKIIMNRVRNAELPEYILLDVGVKICSIGYLFRTQFAEKEFCEKMVRLNMPIFQYIQKNSEIFDEELACSIFLFDKNCYYKKPALTWTIDIPNDRGFHVNHVGASEERPLRILHLSDIHITMDYKVNSLANCGYPMCCKQSHQSYFDFLKGPGAGYWGDYRDCDTPFYMFTDTLQYLNNSFKDIDIIYFTGDVVDHTVWNTSIESNAKTLTFAFKSLLDAFPNKLILPVIGNHESHPLNVFPPPSITDSSFSQQWLYSLLSKLWSPWLPQEAIRSVEYFGYYSFLYKDRLKIIALHNNICYHFNWWLLYDTEYLKIQLHWLTDELLDAESKGQLVHILAHIPPGNKECIEPWEKNYYNLIYRFRHIIKGQFYGHTHTDELKVYLERKSTTPFSVGFNGASLTPFSKNNPNIKVVSVDPTNFEVIDIDTFIFNLTDANLKLATSPKWYKLYSMKDAYGLYNLSADSLYDLSKKLFTDDQIFDKYYRYYVREGDAALNEGYNNERRKRLACEVIKTESLYTDINECNN